ncbi:DUF397 domain-containing protein [Streptosporangium sp. NPDC006007]|uniref:DUF397 domain-containing protein n=1 Tax=Streptosporangium sp. NPDC006007 TaxID=3154575 RepID=UPI0033BBAE58
MISPDLSGAEFRKSSLSGSSNDNCVEVATNLPGLVAVRDSKDPSGPALTFSPAAWSDFLAGIHSGDL